MIAEKQRQIEMIQRTELERSQLKNQLQSLFKEERNNSTKEMRDFMSAF